jgi:hypothetical protein
MARSTSESEVYGIFRKSELIIIIIIIVNSLNRDVLEKLIVAQLAKKFPAFKKPEGAWPYLQYSGSGHYPEPLHILTL